MSTRSVEIAIRARDEASKTFGQVEDRIAGFARSAQTALRLGGALAAARASIGLFELATSLIRRDWEGIIKAIGDIPGVGAPAISLANFLDEHFFGIRENIRKMKEDMEGFQKYIGQRGVVEDLMKDWQNKAQMVLASPQERAKMQAEEEAKRGRRRIYEEAKKGGLEPDHAATRAALVAVDEWLKNRLKEIAAETRPAAGAAAGGRPAAGRYIELLADIKRTGFRFTAERALDTERLQARYGSARGYGETASTEKEDSKNLKALVDFAKRQESRESRRDQRRGGIILSVGGF